MRTSVTTAPFYPPSAGLLARELDDHRVEPVGPPHHDTGPGRAAVVQERQVGLQRALAAASRARSRAAARRAAPSCGRRRRCRSRARPRGAARGLGLALLRMVDGVDDGPRPARPASRFGTIHAVTPSSRMSSRPSASVATIGLPVASASNAVSGVPSQSDGNTLRSNADRTAADVAREPVEDEPIAEAERVAPAPSSVVEQRALADQEEPRLRPCGDDRRAPPSTRYVVALRLVQPRDGADGEIVRARCPAPARVAAISSALRTRLNSSSGAPR